MYLVNLFVSLTFFAKVALSYIFVSWKQYDDILKEGLIGVVAFMVNGYYFSFLRLTVNFWAFLRLTVFFFITVNRSC